MLITLPHPAARISGRAAAVVWKADDRLIAMIASHFAAGKSGIAATCWMPALFTRISQAPAFSISARQSSPLDMSARM